MKERIAIIHGIRTPMAKVGTALKQVSADDLGAMAVREVLQRVPVQVHEIDEVVVGNVAQPSNAANVARVIALKAGLPQSIPAMTVHRNCASGFEAITTSAQRILCGDSTFVLAAGTESMSRIPLLYGPDMQAFFEGLSGAKTLAQKLKVFSTFRLKFLKPVIGVVEGLTDPVCGLIMGLTAENLAKEFRISREKQDQFAVESHHKAAKAMAAGVFREESFPLVLPPKFESVLTDDIGPRATQSMEALQKLRPYFDRKNGTVTVGNACPLTDGAAAVMLCSEKVAKERGYPVLGYLRDYAYAGLEPHRMGLGPVYASAKVFEKTGLSIQDMDLVEMNEAFAVQVMANLMAFESEAFSQKFLGLSKPLGAIDPSILNVNGGAIALGHPVGMTGMRLVITLLKELRRRNKHRGLATLCIGGGQGGSLILETE